MAENGRESAEDAFHQCWKHQTESSNSESETCDLRSVTQKQSTHTQALHISCTTTQRQEVGMGTKGFLQDEIISQPLSGFLGVPISDGLDLISGCPFSVFLCMERLKTKWKQAYGRSLREFQGNKMNSCTRFRCHTGAFTSQAGRQKHGTERTSWRMRAEVTTARHTSHRSCILTFTQLVTEEGTTHLEFQRESHTKRWYHNHCSACSTNMCRLSKLQCGGDKPKMSSNMEEKEEGALTRCLSSTAWVESTWISGRVETCVRGSTHLDNEPVLCLLFWDILHKHSARCDKQTGYPWSTHRARVGTHTGKTYAYILSQCRAALYLCNHPGDKEQVLSTKIVFTGQDNFTQTQTECPFGMSSQGDTE